MPAYYSIQPLYKVIDEETGCACTAVQMLGQLQLWIL